MWHFEDSWGNLGRYSLPSVYEEGQVAALPRPGPCNILVRWHTTRVSVHYRWPRITYQATVRHPSSSLYGHRRTDNGRGAVAVMIQSRSLMHKPGDRGVSRVHTCNSWLLPSPSGNIPRSQTGAYVSKFCSRVAVRELGEMLGVRAMDHCTLIIRMATTSHYIPMPTLHVSPRGSRVNLAVRHGTLTR